MASDRSITNETGKLADNVYRAVLGDILSCRLPGGSVIQERKLAAALGVSRSPMRDALNRLEGEGMLVRLTERLLTVRVITLQDYLHSLDLRALVEPQAAALATPRITDEEIKRLDTLLTTLEDTQEPTAEQHWTFDDALHGTLAERSGNPFLARTIHEMRRYTKIFERQTVPMRLSAGLVDHRKLVTALAARDADKVKAAMAEHIRKVRKRTLAGL
ncbi:MULTISPECIES: GntR family transcriptional regulator [unclassified Chelatococcus]|uniref:GntR family transcriptional regulator n=1 Tax=unclassified Chelatococcus TaxID=2638111 RepID=UPI0002EAC6E1|nr:MULTISPECIES: GntR family transcriptional regulator [unclassified Chelatococcus]ALA16867.1 GntR family transcriptional regulator [Chelatococcus sp. CO-6]